MTNTTAFRSLDNLLTFVMCVREINGNIYSDTTTDAPANQSVLPKCGKFPAAKLRAREWAFFVGYGLLNLPTVKYYNVYTPVYICVKETIYAVQYESWNKNKMKRIFCNIVQTKFCRSVRNFFRSPLFFK